MFRALLVSFIFQFLLASVISNKPEIHQLGCSSSTIQKYECFWELGSNYQARYDVTQKILSPFWLEPPSKIQDSNIIIDGVTLLVKFRNKDYGNIGKQQITVNATNRFGTTSDSIVYYPKQQAIPFPPSGLQVRRKYHDYMEISWKNPKGVALYVDMLIFRLRYKKAMSDEWREIGDLRRKNFELNNVDAFTEYEIQVSAKFETFENQSAGWSQWSTKILTTTDMTKPGSSKNLKIQTTSYRNFTTIHVTWLPPNRRNGPISKYYVRYKFTNSKWSSKISSTATWFDLNARCNTGLVYLIKVGVAAVNVAPDGTEFIGSEQFVASYVCTHTGLSEEDNEDSNGNVEDESKHTGIHTATGLIVVLCTIGLCFTVIIIIVIFYKRSKLHGDPNIEWRFMHLDGPRSQQTETEIFDELPRRQMHNLDETVTSDALSLPHSSSGLGTSECISASNDAINKDKLSECSYEKSSDLKETSKRNDRVKDQWPVSEDFSYVTNDF